MSGRRFGLDATPALLNAPSSRPYAAIDCLTRATTCSSWLTSTRMQWTMPPADRTVSVVSRRPASSQSASCSLAPLAANSFAAARPMPEAAPVITMTLSFSIGFTRGLRIGVMAQRAKLPLDGRLVRVVLDRSHFAADHPDGRASLKFENLAGRRDHRMTIIDHLRPPSRGKYPLSSAT
jgi:hypothetical protein